MASHDSVGSPREADQSLIALYTRRGRRISVRERLRGGMGGCGAARKRLRFCNSSAGLFAIVSNGGASVVAASCWARRCGTRNTTALQVPCRSPNFQLALKSKIDLTQRQQRVRSICACGSPWSPADRSTFWLSLYRVERLQVSKSRRSACPRESAATASQRRAHRSGSCGAPAMAGFE